MRNQSWRGQNTRSRGPGVVWLWRGVREACLRSSGALWAGGICSENSDIREIRNDPLFSRCGIRAGAARIQAPAVRGWFGCGDGLGKRARTARGRSGPAASAQKTAIFAKSEMIHNFEMRNQSWRGQNTRSRGPGVVWLWRGVREACLRSSGALWAGGIRSESSDFPEIRNDPLFLTCFGSQNHYLADFARELS